MPSAIDDILEACQARPQSAALHNALLDAVSGPASAAVIEFFANLDPVGQDEGHRRRIANFLTEAGMDEAARTWAPKAAQAVQADAPANVVSLFGNQAAKDGPLVAERTDVSFADIGGLDDVKQQIRRKIITPFEKPRLFQTFRKRAGGAF